MGHSGVVVEHGWWTQPDPYNRFPEKHGTQADAGAMSSNFIRNMWDAYRDSSAGIGFFNVKKYPVPDNHIIMNNNPVYYHTGATFYVSSAAAGTGITIYDMQGRKIRELGSGTDGRMSWDVTDQGGRPVKPGIYTARIKAGKEDTVIKMAVIQ